MDPEDQVPQAFLDTLARAGFYPKGLRVTSGYLAQLLGPITESLGIEVKKVSRLPKIDAASRDFKRQFR
jgi:hypothetical protein